MRQATTCFVTQFRSTLRVRTLPVRAKLPLSRHETPSEVQPYSRLVNFTVSRLNVSDQPAASTSGGSVKSSSSHATVAV